MRSRAVSFLAASFLALACDPDPPRTGASRAAAPAAPSASAEPARAQALHLTAREGAATFLVDAPLEKIKGEARGLAGELALDPEDLARTRGEIRVDLATLVTRTFEDPSRNEAQTDHARNWMEIGSGTPPAVRESNRFARFVIEGVDLAGPHRLADLPATSGVRAFEATVRGSLRVHGVAEPASGLVAIEVRGEPGASLLVRVTTRSPLFLSLKAHDVKPRDLAGRFLDGALERAGGKIDDRVQISVELTAGAVRGAAILP